MRSLDIVDTSVVMDFLEVQDYSDVLLNRLHEVTLENISGTAPEMALIKLLLEKSSTMRRMDILSTFYEYDDKLVGTLKELNKFWRASPNAEVKFKDEIEQWWSNCWHVPGLKTTPPTATAASPRRLTVRFISPSLFLSLHMRNLEG
ncbi:F-box/FBD/LRR-repeat protein [Forsythia ovata]|uniref:F-box/FBD/LRR-repeat protein n=1 Tax=Forsythia ovata TaxID=205694 RepID=A0ABD1WS65_9LAMI